MKSVPKLQPTGTMAMHVTLIVLVGLLASLPAEAQAEAQAEARSSGDKSACLVGPSFWCRSPTNAAFCRAEDYCKKLEDEGSVKPVDVKPVDVKPVEAKDENKQLASRPTLTNNNSSCASCLNVSQAAIDLLKANGTKQQLEQRLDEACDAIVFPIGKKVCKAAVNMAVELIFAEIKAHVNITAQQICNALDLCVHRGGGNVMGQVVSPLTGSPIECQVCQYLFQYLKSYATDANRRKMIAYFNVTICPTLDPQYRANCSVIVTNITNQLFAIIESETPLAICQTVNACPPGVAKNMMTKTPLQANPFECEICQVGIGFLQPYATEANMNTIIHYIDDNFCSKWMPSQRHNCTLLIKEAAVGILKFINSTTPQEICQQLGACSSAMCKAKLLKLLKPSSNLFECEICKVGIKVLKPYATEANMNMIISYIDDSFCSKWMPSQRHNCTVLITEATVGIFKLINTSTPEQICQQLGVCFSATCDSKLLKMLKQMKPRSNPLACKACQIGAQFLKPYATDANKKTVLDYLNASLCQQLPSDQRANCSKILEMTVGNLFSLLQGLSPQRFCEQMNLCDDQSKKLRGNPIECEACEITVQIMKPYATEENQNKIINYLNTTVCYKYISPAGRANCSALVKNATVAIFQLIEASSPPALCQQIGACDAREKSAQPNRNAIKVSEPIRDSKMAAGLNIQSRKSPTMILYKNPIHCSLCEFIGDAMRLHQDIPTACRLGFRGFPNSIVQSCHSFFAQWKHVLKTQQLKTTADVLQFCAKIEYC